MRFFEPTGLVVAALLAVVAWRLYLMEKRMASKAELEAAVEMLAGKVSTEIGEVTAELARLNGLIEEQDLQPTIDRLNQLSAAVEGIVTPVTPEPTPEP